jgi:hypothetical protein
MSLPWMHRIRSLLQQGKPCETQSCPENEPRASGILRSLLTREDLSDVMLRGSDGTLVIASWPVVVPSFWECFMDRLGNLPIPWWMWATKERSSKLLLAISTQASCPRLPAKRTSKKTRQTRAIKMTHPKMPTTWSWCTFWWL